MKIKKSRLTLLLAVIFSLIWAGCMTVAEHRYPNLAKADQYSNPAYGVQPQRSHMALEGAHNGLTDAQVAQVAGNYTYININSNDAGGSAVGQNNDASRIVAKNPQAKVFAYYKSSYSDPAIHANMGPYGQGFSEGDLTSGRIDTPAQLGWYLRQYVAPQAGVTNGGNIGPPLKFDDNQYFNDLSNPAYQAWMVPNLVAWAKSAPWAGIKFDTSNYLVGNQPPNGNMYGKTTLNDLVCGPGDWDQTGADCPKIAAWNSGLNQEISTMSAALHTIGKQILFNGITPTQPASLNRMLRLMTNYGADGAMDESFCFNVSQPGSTNAALTKYTSIPDDTALMASSNYTSKKLLFQSNYQDDSKIATAPYCIAGFLMGWQPGEDYYRFGQNYGASQLTSLPDPTRNFYPHNGIDEIDLNLGDPTASYVASGNILSRSFQNGFVAVNVGDSTGSVRLPNKLVQFSKGAAGQTYSAGSTVSLAARSGVFFLSDSYLHASSGTTSGQTGSASGKTSGSGTATGTDNGGITAAGNPSLSAPISQAAGSSARLRSLAKKTIIPTISLLVLVVIIFWLLHHYGLLRMSWLYHRHLVPPASISGIVTMNDSLSPAGTVAGRPLPSLPIQPGAIVTPHLVTPSEPLTQPPSHQPFPPPST